jgi:hypothetical protein
MYLLLALDDSAVASETVQSTGDIYMKYNRQILYHE